MASPRFYCPAPLSAHQTIALPAELAHHAVRVRRLGEDAAIILFDGRGGQYPARLIIERAAVWAQVGEWQDVERELDGSLTLVQAIAANEKMDWIVEKAVELGARRLVPITAHRSVPALKGERLTKRQQHWARVAQAASEQCGRNQLMRMDAPRSLADYLRDPGVPGPDQILCCHPDAGAPLKAAIAASSCHIAVLIGPEGGWSREELATAENHHAAIVQFGTRVLRTETAGVALLAAVTALQGWR